MIIDAILSVLAIVINAILMPLEVINIGVDFLCGYTTLLSFFQVIIYLFPWSNLLPLILIVFIILNFKTIVSLINFVLKFIPFFG